MVRDVYSLVMVQCGGICRDCNIGIRHILVYMREVHPLVNRFILAWWESKIMSNYRDMTLAQFADAARNCNPELGAIESSLFNYYSGNPQGTFEDHDGEPNSGKQTALFLASAREIVLELVRRIQELEHK